MCSDTAPSLDHGRAARGKLLRRGLMLVISSPSGAGKTTVARRILEREPEVTMSISVTTRPMRPGERDGVDYHFVTLEHFHAMVAADALLEHAQVFGNFYGTPRTMVTAALAEGRDVMFDIDWQGAQQIADKARDDLAAIFILPPSLAELERRLRTRGQDSAAVIRDRMAKSADEMSHYPEYDYIIVNEDVEATVAKIQAILAAERTARARQIGLDDFVRGLRGQF